MRPKPTFRRPPEVLTEKEVLALLGACGGSPTGLRHRALIAVLYRAGLRIAEALSLAERDVDLARGTVNVRRGKGRTWRVVGLDAGACAIVARWIETRRAAGMASSEFLFCTRSGAAISAAFVRRLLPELARKAGIAKRVHAHGLRHTHASELRTEGVDVGIISRQLGHQSLLTTIVYLDHVCPARVVEAVRGRAW